MGRSRPRGVTLIEVVFALGVATVVLLTLAMFISTVHRNAREGKSQAIASVLTTRTLERLHSDEDFFNRVYGSQGSELVVTEVQQFYKEGNLAPIEFRIRASLAPLPDGENRYYDALVVVEWTEGGRVRKLAAETYLPNPSVR